MAGHAGVANNVIAAVAGLVSLVQAVRSDPLWILLGMAALAGLALYWLRRKRSAYAVAGLVGLLAFGAGGWYLATTFGGKGEPSTAAPNQNQNQAAGPATIFDDVVQLDKKTGVDLDGGRPEKLYRQDAAADLYLDWGYVLYSSVRHSTMYLDNNAGPEKGAYDRCREHELAGDISAGHFYIGGGSQQYCFTTSEGHPAWITVVNQVADGGLIAKVTVWRK